MMMKSLDSLEAARSHTPGQKTAGSAGLEQSSDAWIPIKDVVEPFP